MNREIKKIFIKIFKVAAIIICVLTLLWIIVYFLAVMQLITNERAGIKSTSDMQLKGFERLVGWGKHYHGTDEEESHNKVGFYFWVKGIDNYEEYMERQKCEIISSEISADLVTMDTKLNEVLAEVVYEIEVNGSKYCISFYRKKRGDKYTACYYQNEEEYDKNADDFY